jgi:hypothetical protein
MLTKFLSQNLKEGDHWKESRVDFYRSSIKVIFLIWLWTELNWFRIGFIVGLL